jgi:hypothetical protein
VNTKKRRTRMKKRMRMRKTKKVNLPRKSKELKMLSCLAAIF